MNTLQAARVVIAIGSDGIRGETPMATGLDEALYLSHNGFFDNLSLLKMWSEVTPRTIFPKQKIGALSEGFEANFLVLNGNPIIDFSHVRRINMRVKLGHVIVSRKAIQNLRSARLTSKKFP